MRVNRFINTIATSPWILRILLLIAVAERGAWSFLIGEDGIGGEAKNVAMAISKSAGFADAYFVGSGPTAHLMPTTPLLAGIILTIFGSNNLKSEVILILWAIVQVLINLLLLFRLFEKLEVSKYARLTGLAFLCILPVFISQESIDFQYWEGGLASILCLTSLNIILRLNSYIHIYKIYMYAIALLAGLTFFVNPTIGISVYFAYTLLLIRHFSFKSIIVAILIAATTLGFILTPWIIRNYFNMGHVIILRDNLGLELTIANNDMVFSRADHGGAFLEEMKTFHPYFPGFGRKRLLEIGEYPYLLELKDKAKDWIFEHPFSFIRLCLRHLRQMFFPDPWQLWMPDPWNLKINSTNFRAVLIAIISSVGLLGLAAGLFRNFQVWQYLAVIMMTIAMLYMPFQPMPRYIYLIYNLLVFCAADLIFRAFDFIRRKKLHTAKSLF